MSFPLWPMTSGLPLPRAIVLAIDCSERNYGGTAGSVAVLRLTHG